MSEWPEGDYLAGLLAAIYRVLGEAAPHFTRDAHVVQAHETARMLGECVHALRDDETTPDPFVEALLRRAVEEDPSGSFALFTVAMLVGPRILITVHDLRATTADDFQRALLDRTADALVTVTRRIGATASRVPTDSDPRWLLAVQEMHDQLSAAGYDESFGPEK